MPAKYLNIWIREFVLLAKNKTHEYYQILLY